MNTKQPPVLPVGKKKSLAKKKKIIRLPVVMAQTGLGRSTIYLRIADKSFPKPVSLGSRAVGWIEGEIQEWLKDRIQASRQINP